MRTGVRLGIDVGKARIGVARSDLHGMLATPVETIARATDGTADLDRIVELSTEFDCVEIVVGLPLSLSGAHTASTDDATGFADRIAEATGRAVRLIDERLTTVSAQSALHTSGRKVKGSRAVIDQIAAVILLQHALDSEASTGNPPGTDVAA
ncbi:Holliday junction resolvase RuvX [Agreia sp. COWG]|uniref:Holliday junction resolvase RuvX n=1 Tax=Agreia sp. COWG TaxID=2773266 RepID=UPI0019286240|nr:Holliday junction resolvase RuvX [Agreia sp. COWG]CAD5998508.1 Putative pre-16S rRNA nuclease [Agreia sp. COWG]